MASSAKDNKIASLSRGRRLALFGTLSLILLLVIFAIAETTVRTRMYFKYGTFWGFEVKEYDSTTGLTTPKPNYVSGPVVINSLGFRSPELAEPRPENLIRLAFLGGSTTFSQEVSGNDMVWANVLTQELQKKYPTQPFDHINASATAFTVPESLTNLKMRVAKHDPDIIFIYHAVNDIAVNIHNLAREEGHHVPDRLKNDRLRKILDVSLLADLIHKNLSILLSKRKGPEPSTKVPFNKERMTEQFRQDLQLLVTEAQNTADMVVIPTFSNHLRDHQSPEQQLKAAETHMYHIPLLDIDNLLLAFSSYNEVIREFAAHDNVLVIETESALEGTPEIFIDSVHFTEKGNVLMGEYLASELTSAELFQSLLSSQ